MKTIISTLLSLLVALGISAQNKSTLNIIPEPVKSKVTAGQFTFNASTKFVITPDNQEMRNSVGRIIDQFSTAAGFDLQVTSASGKSNVVICKLDNSIAANEGYKLSINKDAITITAKNPNGIFYALQTVRQLLPPQLESVKKAENVTWTLPCAEIEDAPRYNYRGLHLDCSRHFWTKEFVMQYIDLLAYHKMNTFHWHLTDDQGWRIEIKKYPDLTKKGGYRNRTLKGQYYSNDALRQWDTTRYGGYYTQEDVKEVVAYAQKRFVTVIPEIEMPGHAVAALTAYPKLSCTGGPFEVEGLWGVFEDIFCAGNDDVFSFLEDVLTEVMPLFPSEYIHIGGDEAPKTRWERCHACQERMEKEGLKNEHELQSYFIKRMEKFINSKGKRIIGWDEILEGGLAPNATVMSWRGQDGGIAAARQGHDVIMTPNSHVYLDYYQSQSKMEPHGIGGYLPIWHVYSYNPTPAVLTPEQAKHIIGYQGNLWTEYVLSNDHVIYMVYPRAAAIAETAWSPNEKKNYDYFHSRLMEILHRYNAMGINYNRTFLSEERDLKK